MAEVGTLPQGTLPQSGQDVTSVSPPEPASFSEPHPFQSLSILSDPPEPASFSEPHPLLICSPNIVTSAFQFSRVHQVRCSHLLCSRCLGHKRRQKAEFLLQVRGEKKKKTYLNQQKDK